MIRVKEVVMELPELMDKLNKEFSNLDDRYGYIVYCFDRSINGQGTGFHRNADKGDAMVAIQRIVKVFDIDPVALIAALTE